MQHAEHGSWKGKWEPSGPPEYTEQSPAVPTDAVFCGRALEMQRTDGRIHSRPSRRGRMAQFTIMLALRLARRMVRSLPSVAKLVGIGLAEFASGAYRVAEGCGEP